MLMIFLSTYLIFFLKYFLKVNAIIDVPAKVAVQYNHRLLNMPDNKAGASERAGFIDAPDINAKKNRCLA